MRRNLLVSKKIGVFVIVFAATFLLLSLNSAAQTQTFNSNGTFTVPPGVTSIIVECWGGGGAGGGNNANNSRGGGGGAGGAYARKTITVNSGNVFTVTVGAQKDGTTGDGGQGNPSWFGSTSTIYAEGGAGGKAPNSSIVAGGIGSAANSIGDVFFAGGDGASGTTNYGGGGGGGAGSSGIGGSASGTTAGNGTTMNGGDGGSGRNDEGNGIIGTRAGGGGGGAFIPDNSNHNGGGGGAGQVVITWDISSSTDYFRTRASGNWNDVNTWASSSDGSNWITATLPPNNNAKTVTILNGNTVTVTANVTVDQVIVDGGGQVAVSSGQTLTIANGTGTDMTVNGTLVNSGTIITTGTLSFGSGSTYNHAQNGGTIPTATWNLNSTCYITGCRGTAPGGYNQTFGNFTWECDQTTYLALGTITNRATTSILGNLTVARTGNRITGQNNDFNIEGDITIGGNFIIANSGDNPAIYRLCYGENRSQTVNGNVIITGGELAMNTNTGGSFLGTLNVKGDFIHTEGIVSDDTGGGTGIIVFDGTGMQTYTSGGTLSGQVSFKVNSGAYLQMGTGDSPAIISNGSSGTFTLSSGATLGITSPDGITTSGATGNIQLTGTRTYNTGGNYIYNGTLAQVTGNGLTQNTPANVSIDNSAGISLSNNLTTTGVLTLSNGLLKLNTYNLTLNNEVSGTFGNTRMIVPESTGQVIRNFTTTGSYLFPVGSSSPAIYSPVSLVANTASSGAINVSLINNQDISADYDSYLKRRWTVTASGITNYNINCIYDASDVVGNESLLRGAKSNGSWVFYNPVNTATHQFSMNGLSSFSQFSAAADLTVSASASSASVCSGSQVDLSASVSGGKAPYTWVWTSSPSGFNSTSQSPSANPTVTTSYSVTVNDSKGKTASANVPVTVSPLPAMATGLSNQTRCGDGSVTFSVTDPGTGYTVEWSTDGITNNDGSSAGGSGNLTKIKAVTVGNTVTIYARISNNTTLCKSLWSIGYTGTANALPTITLGTVSSICAGATSFTIPYAGTTGTPDQYSISGTGITTVTNGALGVSPITVNLSSPASGSSISFDLTVRNSTTGCISNIVNGSVSINDKPTLTAISSPAAICAGGNYSLSAPTVTANGSPVTSQGWEYSSTSGGTYSALTNSNIPYSYNGYYIRYYATNACGTTYSGPVQITVNSSTSIMGQSTAGQTQCINGTFSSISVTASGTGTLSYQWYNNTTASTTGGTSLGPANGAQTNSFTPQSATVGTLYYYCVVTGTCGTVTSTVSGSFKVNPKPTVTVSSDISICDGSSTVLTASGASSYSWSPATGLSSTTGSSVTASPSSNTTYTVTGTDENGCINTTQVTVTVNPLPTPVVTGDLSPCNKATGVIYSTEAGMTEYNWTISGGTITSGQGTNSINVTWNVDGSQTLGVSYKNANGCLGLATSTITVHPIPVIGSFN